MTKYISYFRIRFNTGLQYRAAAIAGITTQFAWGFMMLILYLAFYESNPNTTPMGISQLASYIWLNQSFLMMFMVYVWENDIFEAITSGGVAYDLCRTMDIYNMWFSKSVATRLSKTVLRCFPVIFLSMMLGDTIGLSAPIDLNSFIAFILSLFLGMFVLVSFSMLIYVGTFYTQSSTGLRIMAFAVGEILSGAVVPFPFLPSAVRFVFELLPFAYIQNIPFRIYIGDIRGSEIYISILLQLFWLVSLVIIGKILMNKALKQIVVQGG